MKESGPKSNVRFLPLVSVVLPVHYVQLEWLTRSISSVLEQDHPSLELIVVNDEATQDIDDLIARFGIQKYVKNERNRKLPYSLNRGFDIAEGELHTWTSADNFMLPGMISRLVRELEERRELSIVCGRSVILDEHGSVLDLPPFEAEVARLAGSSIREAIVPRSYTYYSSLGACFLYRKAVWESLGGYDERLHGTEDYDFWIRASRSSCIGRIPWAEPPLYAYRLHKNSISATVRDCFTRARVEVLLREARRDRDDQELRGAIEYYRSQIQPTGIPGAVRNLIQSVRWTIERHP